jgi:hypothetical protein
MAPQAYYRRWDAYLRGERIGEVLAATQESACLRAIRKFKIRDEDRPELEVRRQTPDRPIGLKPRTWGVQS